MSERIIEDIAGFPGIVDKIIAAKGCVVPDEDFRSGRRHIKANGEAAKGKARARQKKDTLVSAPLHPDCEEARTAFLQRHTKK